MSRPSAMARTGQGPSAVATSSNKHKNMSNKTKLV